MNQLLGGFLPACMEWYQYQAWPYRLNDPTRTFLTLSIRRDARWVDIVMWAELSILKVELIRQQWAVSRSSFSTILGLGTWWPNFDDSVTTVTSASQIRGGGRFPAEGRPDGGGERPQDPNVRRCTGRRLPCSESAGVMCVPKLLDHCCLQLCGTNLRISENVFQAINSVTLHRWVN